ncbi:GNAT family N-acetyltransferase [Actinoplanes sp. NPDC024001]|uniref:GNAT family N-acetyltransferase n=1 Tax=Actinoplanes sp. NPDC024001 TaxID=3154598 RepID=UPI0033E13643
MIMLETGDQLDSAAKLLWAVWDAATDAERSEVISASMLRTLAHAGNYVAGAYLDGELVGCTVGLFGRRGKGADYLHSHITGVHQPERNRGTGFALKRHQRLWALECGYDTVTWTFDPLVSRNGYFNFCKLGATVSEYVKDFYGQINDGANNGDHTDRLIVNWSLRSERVEQAMRDEPGWPKHARVVPGAEVVAVPKDIRALRDADPRRASAARLETRERFLRLLDAGYQIVGMSRGHDYVLLPAGMTPEYES